ncbi:MAG: hypothetical protein ACO3WU_06710 [Ilumatobacteraceae bacterium]
MMDERAGVSDAATPAALRADEFLERWHAAGLLTDAQRDAISAFEASAVVARRRLTLVAEIATYLGAVIAFAGGAAVVAPNWDRIGVIGQVGVGGAIALVGFVSGRLLVGFGESGTDRVGWFLWAIGTGGIALVVAALMNAIDPRDQAWFPVAIGVVVAGLSGVLWRNLDRPLQLATAGVGAMMTIVGGAELVDADVWVLGPVIWLGSAVLGVAAGTGRLRPRLVAWAMASVGSMIGSFVFMDANEQFAAVLAVVTAAGIVTVAMIDRSIPLVVIGVLSFFVATTTLMQVVLHGMVQRLAAALLGLLVVGVVAVRAQHLGQPRHG